jgi:hypothetical protein
MDRLENHAGGSRELFRGSDVFEKGNRFFSEAVIGEAACNFQSLSRPAILQDMTGKNPLW